ncbi:hypothetical protein [Chryseobacterium sp. LC2016-29]|uniref:hypothetical protein n=1 Tax=Chryseobacterium sp. LC2016-29 TaxID=2897331 RepID=UPI001E518BEF|nr:hypothetical protein [Chryseobacterium sp. LC2016-29]
MRTIIYNNTVYQISEEQYERLSDVIQEAKNLPFAGELHLEEYLNFNIDQYVPIGEIDLDVDDLISQ